MIKINWDNIPNNPGVYLWKDKDGQVIYVGKAKNLKKRMKQYFDKKLSLKNELMIKKVEDFDFQISSNEIDALVLEQNLINEYEPKFNIKVKGSKIYPYIEVSNNKVVSVRVTRKTKNKNSKYFGPYPDGFSPRKIIELLNSALPIDKCYSPNSGKECLNYTMNRCLGYCIKDVSENEKKFVYNMAIEFLSGKTNYIKQKINNRLENFNNKMQYEESMKIVEYLNVIEKIEKQKNNGFNDSLHRDVFNYYQKNNVISFSILHIRFGNINFTTNYITEINSENDNEDIESLIHRYYLDNPMPNEIIVPFELEWNEGISSKITVPIKGTKKHLLDLVYESSKSKYESSIDAHLDKLKSYKASITFLKKELNMNKINLIEMADISSTMGKQQVGAVVAFKYGEPYKHLYRKYIIKDIDKMDDYLSMAEVVERHFKRKLEDNLEMPDLFIVDGKYQLTKAKEIINDLNIKNVKVVALKKDDHHKTDSLLDENYNEINIKDNNFVYLFLSKIQEEVHRFAINFHRSKRDKEIIESELDKFKFLSSQNKNDLFLEFKSIRKIFIASKEDLIKVIGTKKTTLFLKQRE